MTVHDAVITYVAAVIAEHQLSGDVLDLGGRYVNGTTRDLFPDGHRYVVVDIREHPSVDIVADAGDLDLDETFDIVVSTECFEHTPRGGDIVARAYRHLRPGGMFVATMAGPGRAPHGSSGEPEPGQEWYCNVEPDELERWLVGAGFGEYKIDQLDDDVRCWARR